MAQSQDRTDQRCIPNTVLGMARMKVPHVSAQPLFEKLGYNQVALRECAFDRLQ